MHDTAALALAVVSILSVLGAFGVLAFTYRRGVRDDRLKEAWDRDREAATVALNKGRRNGGA